jgi:hypothetical protein
MDYVGGEEGQREEEQAEDEVADEAVPLAVGDTRGPERQRDPDRTNAMPISTQPNVETA